MRLTLAVNFKDLINMAGTSVSANMCVGMGRKVNQRNKEKADGWISCNQFMFDIVGLITYHQV
jgi:hypothetical protein